MIQTKNEKKFTADMHGEKSGTAHISVKRVFAVLLIIVIMCMMIGSCNEKEKENADIDTNIAKNEENKLYVDFIDVGKGDCILIRFNSHNYIIDTGYEETTGNVISFLQQKNVKTIDGMIITHFDKDHVGGAREILSRYEVKSIYMPDYEGEGNKYKKFKKYLEEKSLDNIVTRVKQNICIETEGIQINIYPPLKEQYEDENDYSLVIKMIYKEDSFLFAADAEEARIEELLGNTMLKSNVLKVPYHGILGKNNIQFIDEVRPQYSIITTDMEEDVSTSIIYELEEIGSEYYFNCNGNINCISDGTGNITISQN